MRQDLGQTKSSQMYTALQVRLLLEMPISVF